MINKIQQRAIVGKSAHLSAKRALEGLKVDATGKKILNTPYTIWQLLKHINYWQNKWMIRLDGAEVIEDVNATSQEELEEEISRLLTSIEKLNTLLQSEETIKIVPNENYSNHHDIVQAIASHLSYHIGELILLRRIFGCWPPPQGGYVW